MNQNILQVFIVFTNTKYLLIKSHIVYSFNCIKKINEIH